MPNVKSAEKRVKTNKKKEIRNRAARSAFRSAMKKVNTAIEEKNTEAATAALPGALSLIGKSRRKGIIHKNKAARQESRLMKKIKTLETK